MAMWHIWAFYIPFLFGVDGEKLGKRLMGGVGVWLVGAAAHGQLDWLGHWLMGGVGGLVGGTRCVWAVGFVVVWLLVTWVLYVVGGRGGSVR